MPTAGCDSLVALLERRAAQAPTKVAYRFDRDGALLPTDADPVAHVTYIELLGRAAGVARTLEAAGVSGGRALLLFPAGIEFVVALFGCLLARVTAVPAAPPHGRLERFLPRLAAIISDADASVGLSTSAMVAAIEGVSSRVQSEARLAWIPVDEIPPDESVPGRPAIDPDDIAILQYTSGSTGTPKGVTLRHRQLLAELESIEKALPPERDGWANVNWMPLFHDGGLFGGVLLPLYLGIESLILAPEAFLTRPFRWLRAISNTRATMSASPNFGYDLCVRKVTEEQRQSLDLTSWRVAVNSAEPVRRDTLERFVGTFGAAGFREQSFITAWGLAEASLLVTARPPAKVTSGPTFLRLDRDALEEGRVRAATADAARFVDVVGCGPTLEGQDLAIVDPATHGRVTPDSVGEIWVSGPNVSDGYWHRDAPGVFAAQIHGEDERYLRTGDLGFVHDGELFPTGRLKDVIIIRGRNHYPQDIEAAVGESHPRVRPGCGAAFALDVNGVEGAFVVQEVDLSDDADVDADVVMDAIRGAMAPLGIQPVGIALVSRGSIFKTSSGKIQRSACKTAYANDDLEILAEWRRAEVV